MVSSFRDGCFSVHSCSQLFSVVSHPLSWLSIPIPLLSELLGSHSLWILGLNELGSLMYTLLPAVLALVLSILADGTPIFLTLGQEALGAAFDFHVSHSPYSVWRSPHSSAFRVHPESGYNPLAPWHPSCVSSVSAFQLVFLV